MHQVYTGLSRQNCLLQVYVPAYMRCIKEQAIDLNDEEKLLT